jgi:dTDP-glucose 4,6-dehydratase
MGRDEDMIEYVQDRPGHDRRYSTEISKIRDTLFWTPMYSLEHGLRNTIKWYESSRN